MSFCSWPIANRSTRSSGSSRWVESGGRADGHDRAARGHDRVRQGRARRAARARGTVPRGRRARSRARACAGCRRAGPRLFCRLEIARPDSRRFGPREGRRRSLSPRHRRRRAAGGQAGREGNARVPEANHAPAGRSLDDNLRSPLNDTTADKLRWLSAALQRVSETTGNLVAWLTVPMVVGTFVIVVLRYAFDVGWIWMQEGAVWLHALVFMLAAAYTLKHDEHVRVDILYRRLSRKRRALVDVLGILLLLLPVSIFILAVSWDYVETSWRIREGSR